MDLRPTRSRPPPPPESPYPWLLLVHGNENKKQAFYDVSRNSTKIKSVPELQGVETDGVHITGTNKDLILHFSFHGWLVLKRKKNLYLWNPQTLEQISLPYLDLRPARVVEMILTSPPENPDSSVVAFLFMNGNYIRGNFICRVNDGDRRWVRADYSEETVSGDHWLCRGNLGSNNVRMAEVASSIGTCTDNGEFPLDVEVVGRDAVKVITVEEPSDSKYYCWNKMIYPPVESCGDIFNVEVEFGGVDRNEVIKVVIFKLDFRNQVRKQIKTCGGDKVFFMDPRKAYCFPTDSHRLRNKVFFTKFHCSLLYTYDMEDQSISISAPFHEVASPWRISINDLMRRKPSPWKTPVWVLPGPANLGQLNCSDQSDPSNLVRLGGPRQSSCNAYSLTLPTKKTQILEGRKEDVFQLEGLPDGVFHEVCKHLDSSDYMTFRAVNTRLRNAVPPKISRDQRENHTYPWLIRPFSVMDQTKSNLVLSEEEMCGTTYANFSMVDPKFGADRTFYMTTPEITKNSVIIYSRYGWLLMAAGLQSMRIRFLYNPLTKEVIHLPESTVYPSSAFFSSSPDLPDCLVVVVSCDKPPQMAQTRPRIMNEWEYIQVLDREEAGAIREYHGWTKTSHTYPVVLDNIFYFLGHERNMFALTVNDDTTFWALKVRIPCTSSYNQNFLVACDGELLAVIVGPVGEWIKVFKLSRSGETRVWNEVKDLGNNCLYLSGLSTFAVKSDDPEMKNKIYFTKFYGESLIYYSMKTRKLHYKRMRDGSIVEGSLNDFSQCKEHCLSLWFELC